MEKIKLQKDTYQEDSYSNIIDKEFKEFDVNQDLTPLTRPTVEDFFKMYNELFYDIPKEGDAETHRALVDRSAQYLGLNVSTESIQALIDEVTSLRQQLLDIAKSNFK